MGALFFLLAGCDKQGPAEKAGEKFDNAVESMGEKMEEAGDSFRDGPAEKAGEKLDNAVEKTGEKLEEAGESLRNAAKGGE
jgi:hypothetical protein